MRAAARRLLPPPPSTQHSSSGSGSSRGSGSGNGSGGDTLMQNKVRGTKRPDQTRSVRRRRHVGVVPCHSLRTAATSCSPTLLWPTSIYGAINEGRTGHSSNAEKANDGRRVYTHRAREVGSPRARATRSQSPCCRSMMLASRENTTKLRSTLRVKPASWKLEQASFVG